MTSLLRAALQRGSPNANLLSVGIGRSLSGDDGPRATVREAERVRAIGEILFPDRVIHEYDATDLLNLFQHGNERPQHDWAYIPTLSITDYKRRPR